VPKGSWLNVGSGTAVARQVRSAWATARGFFLDQGHIPESAREPLQHMEGHSYYLFDPAHLEACHRDGAFLVGDALGLAHPFTAEGILPAVLSGRLCAEAILSGDSGRYRDRLEHHPTIQDYALTRDLLRAAIALRTKRHGSRRTSTWLERAGRFTTPRLFAWMFGGRPIPGGHVLHAALRLRSSREATA